MEGFVLFVTHLGEKTSVVFFVDLKGNFLLYVSVWHHPCF